MTVISDSKGVESLGGIMGGLHSGCTDKTENVFLEAAYFDPIRTAYTGRELRLIRMPGIVLSEVLIQPGRQKVSRLQLI